MPLQVTLDWHQVVGTIAMSLPTTRCSRWPTDAPAEASAESAVAGTLWKLGFEEGAVPSGRQLGR
jgi:hypothetical protein